MTSTLALKKADFETEVGLYMGWGRGADPDPVWSVRQVAEIRMAVASGLRLFYCCGHSWSFLNQSATLTLPIGHTTLALPDNFGGIDGGARLTICQASDGQGRFIVDFTGIGRVIQAQSLTPSATGIPRLVAMRPLKGVEPGKMQRTELVIYPTPEQEYVLKFPYVVTPDYLTDVATPYALAGLEHHETIKALCLQSVEQDRDDRMTVHSSKAEDLLQKSIAMDRRKHPIKLGYNRDLSDSIGSGPYGELWNGHGWNTSQGVTIDGVVYD